MWGSGNCWMNYSELLEVVSRAIPKVGVPKGRGGSACEQAVPKGRGGSACEQAVPKGRGGLLILRSVVEANL